MTTAVIVLLPSRDGFTYYCERCHQAIYSDEAGGMNPYTGEPFCKACAPLVDQAYYEEVDRQWHMRRIYAMVKEWWEQDNR